MNSLPQSAGIYQITCIPTNKIYIGSSADISLRWYRHVYALNNGNHHNSHLQNAWLKYGGDAFVVDVLELCDCDVLKEREQYHLDTQKPFSPNGFNIAYDALRPQLGREVSEETRAKMSAIHKGKIISDKQRTQLSIIHKGRKHTPEAVANMSAAQKGHAVSPETAAKISASNKGKSLSPDRLAQLIAVNTGKKRSEETKAKISAAHMGISKGRIASPETREKQSAVRKKAYIVTTPEGVEIHIKGLADFCKEHGLDANGMGRVANGSLPHYKRWLCRHA